MQKRRKKVIKIVSIVLGGLVVLLVLAGFWLYTGRLTPAKTALFKIIPYPLALVNSHPVFMKDFLFRYEVSKKMFGADVVTQKEPVIKQQIYSQLIDEQKTGLAAGRHGVYVSGKEIDAEYKARAEQTDLQGKKNFEELIASYGLSASSYKSNIIEPGLLKANLQVWFNSQKDLNKGAFTQAEDLVKKIQAGQNMVVLAVDNTQDETERGTGGDLGFTDPSLLLSELREPVASMKLGEVKIVPSRYGLHIIRAEGKNGNKLHLREIFLKTGDFNQWYQNETKNFSVRQLVKI